MILQDSDSKPNSDWFGKILSRALLGGLIVTHLLLDILALLRGLRGALVSRGLKVLFLYFSRALLGILSGALLCHLIMAEFTLNIAVKL